MAHVRGLFTSVSLPVMWIFFERMSLSLGNIKYYTLLGLFYFSSLEICGFAEDVDTGGWFTDPEIMLAEPGPCNIEIKDKSLTQKEFLEKYAYQAPVILKDITNNAKFKEMSQRHIMLQSYGSKKIRLSSANTHSYRKVDVTLKEYVNKYLKPQSLMTYGNETLYWFGDNNHTEWEDMFNEYQQPPYKLPGLDGAYSFGVAGAGTGVPFHFHGPGFAEVIYGRKRWFLYPPHQQPKFNPDKTTLSWVLEDYPKLHGPDKPYECTIGPGEVIYFPDHWWHGTLNIDTSVFISTFLG